MLSTIGVINDVTSLFEKIYKKENKTYQPIFVTLTISFPSNKENILVQVVSYCKLLRLFKQTIKTS